MELFSTPNEPVHLASTHSGRTPYDVLEKDIPGGPLGSLEQGAVGERKIYLTRLSMDCLSDMHEYSKDARLYRYLEFQPHKDIEETRLYLQKLINRMGPGQEYRQAIYWFIHLVESKKAIGSVGLVNIDFRTMSAAWGFAISPDYWGQGHILEVQALVIRYAFEEVRLNRLHGVTMVDNEPTIASITTAGFKQEGILRDYYLCSDGKRKDALVYSMLAKDYFTATNERSTAPRTFLTNDDIRAIAASLFQMQPESFDANTTMRDVPLWNSLNHIRFITAIEKKAGVKFKPVDIARATRIGAILDLVNSAGRR
jgi:ribosomal-protein-alanine N-acetyltransferase